jgi:hypothetical protein
MKKFQILILSLLLAGELIAQGMEVKEILKSGAVALSNYELEKAAKVMSIIKELKVSKVTGIKTTVPILQAPKPKVMFTSLDDDMHPLAMIELLSNSVTKNSILTLRLEAGSSPTVRTVFVNNQLLVKDFNTNATTSFGVLGAIMLTNGFVKTDVHSFIESSTKSILINKRSISAASKALKPIYDYAISQKVSDYSIYRGTNTGYLGLNSLAKYLPEHCKAGQYSLGSFSSDSKQLLYIAATLAAFAASSDATSLHGMVFKDLKDMLPYNKLALELGWR